jgi:ABC-type transport system substrate-binding protein
MKRRQFRVLLTLLLGMGLSACGSTASAHTGTLRIPVYGSAYTIDTGIFDPARASAATPLFLASLVQSGLVKYSPDLHIIPELAVSLPTISPSGLSYTFTVRQGTRFADGRPGTAADIAYSFARALSPRTHSSLARAYLGGISGAAQVETGVTTRLSGVHVVDPLTVRIRLIRPDATFLEKLAFPEAAIVERDSSPSQPAGLGPWQLAVREADGSDILLPRPHYYGGSLQVRALRLVPVADARAGITLYRRGSLDLARVPSDQYRQLASRSDFRSSASLDAYYALPGGGKNGLALAADLDRDQLVSGMSPQLSPLDSIVPPSIPDYLGSSPSIPDDAGASGPAATIRVADARDGIQKSLKASLLRQWKSPGSATVDVRLVHLTYQLPDPGRWLLTVVPQTPSHWFRSLIAQANALTNDPVTRMNLYSEGESWAIQQGLIIPLASGSIAYLVRPSVQSLQVTPAGMMPENNNWSLVSVT